MGSGFQQHNDTGYLTHRNGTCSRPMRVKGCKLNKPLNYFTLIKLLYSELETSSCCTIVHI